MAASMVSQPVFVTASLCCVLGLSAVQGLGFGANYLDISLFSTGLVAGVGNTVATVGSNIGPNYASKILAGDGKPGPEAWKNFFVFFAMANLVGWCIYVPLCTDQAVDAPA